MEELIAYVSALDPFWVYVAVMAIAYIENLFPPFPSDVIVVVAGSLIGLGRIDFVTALLLTSAASTLGFMTMYKVGDWFGDRILESGRIRFLPVDQLHRVEGWFRRYGSWVVIANRFLAGTRAVVAFFIGMSEFPLGRTILLSFLSSLVWNAILLFAGRELGANWRQIAVYLKTYGEIITIAVIVIVIVVGLRYIRKTTPAPPEQGGPTGQ